MRASTTPTYYTLFFEVEDSAESDSTPQCAILRRDCCGYHLELSERPFVGKSFRGENLGVMEHNNPEAFSEFLAIARLCSVDGFHVAPESSRPRDAVSISLGDAKEQ